MQSILEDLKLKKIINEYSYDFRLWNKKENKELRSKIENIKIDNFNSFQEKIWFFMNDLKSRPVCYCGNLTNLISVEKGFNKFCSIRCGVNSPLTKDKKIETSFKRYNVSHFTKSKNYKDLCKQQMIKYGYRPGGFNTIEHKNSIFKKYNVNNINNSVEIKDKIKKTLLYRYNVDAPFKSKLIQEKCKLTFLKKYGTDYPLKNKHIFKKCQRARFNSKYKFKYFVSPSNKKIWYQGYEKHIIEYLWKAGILEHDLINDKSHIPTIKYNYKNKQRFYFPDIFIKSLNMLIEVKTAYSFDSDIEKHLSKQRGAISAGFKHIIIIWNEKHSRIDEIIGPEFLK